MNDALHPPACKRSARREDRRRAMLDVARASFLEHGYAATSMSGIAATLGGSKATLWSYFPSKEALFEAVLDDATVAYRQQQTEQLGLSGDLRQNLERFTLRLLTKLLSAPGIALHRLVAAEGVRFPEVVRIFHERAVQVTERLLSGFIAQQMAEGALRSDDPSRAARLLIGQCTLAQQRAMWGVEQWDEARIAADATAAVDLLLRAYAPEPVSAPSAAVR